MSETFQLFNLATMSGVFPGTRTLVYQRARLRKIDELPSVHMPGAEQPLRWARILWYDNPPACVVEIEAPGAAAMGTSSGQSERLVHIPDPEPLTLVQALSQALAATGWQLVTCSGCAHWEQLRARTPDGLVTGHCQYREGASVAVPPVLAVQSMLALSCTHWDGRPRRATGQDTEPFETITPIRKRAEQENDERWTLRGQLRRWLRRSAPTEMAEAAVPWQERVVERSGVGAGTEPCFACQGRIANLGALAVATPEGDKQTFSVWRCRACYTYYLNDWIDRWERTDSLEIEERYYRLSPSEAMEVLAVMDNVVHAEHPARRHERNAQRSWMLAFLGDRPLLSHQIRQGR